MPNVNVGFSFSQVGDRYVSSVQLSIDEVRRDLEIVSWLQTRLSKHTFQVVAQPGIRSLIVVDISEWLRSANSILPSHGQFDFCSTSTILSSTGTDIVADEYM